MPLVPARFCPYRPRTRTEDRTRQCPLSHSEPLPPASPNQHSFPRYAQGVYRRGHNTLPSLAEFGSGVLPGVRSSLHQSLRALRHSNPPPTFESSWNIASDDQAAPRALVDTITNYSNVSLPDSPIIYVPFSAHLSFKDALDLTTPDIVHEGVVPAGLCLDFSQIRIGDSPCTPSPQIHSRSDTPLGPQTMSPANPSHDSTSEPTHKSKSSVPRKDPNEWIWNTEDLGKNDKGEVTLQCLYNDPEYGLCAYEGHKETVIRHYRGVHQNIRPHICSYPDKKDKDKICGKGFGQFLSLTIHICSVHTGETPFKCKLCPQAFPDPARRHKHVLRNHKKEAPAVIKPRRKAPFADCRKKSTSRRAAAGLRNKVVGSSTVDDSRKRSTRKSGR